MSDGVVSGLPEALGGWIEEELQRVQFEGEPEVMARYVVALLESQLEPSDDPIDVVRSSLYSSCVHDLEDFLGDETHAFVKNLLLQLPDSVIPHRQQPFEPQVQQSIFLPINQEPQNSLHRTNLVVTNEVQPRQDQNQPQRPSLNTAAPYSSQREEQPLKPTDLRNTLGGGRRGPPKEERGPHGRDRDRGGRGGHTQHGSESIRMPYNFAVVDDDEQKYHATKEIARAAAHPANVSGFNGTSRGRRGPADRATMQNQEQDYQMEQAMARAKAEGDTPHPASFGASGVRRGAPDRGGRGGGRGGGLRDRNPRPVDGEGSERTLVVRNLPDDKLNIMEIGEWFKQFGTITNIQLVPAEKPDRAYVEFSAKDMAQAAMESIEAIMGNRHVRIFWAHRDSKVQAVHGAGNRGGRRNGVVGSDGDRSQNGGASKREFQASAPVPVVETEPQLSAEEINARKRKEILAAREEQKKRKLEEASILQEKIEEQKSLLESLESNGSAMSAEEKKSVLEKIKSVSATITPPSTTGSAQPQEQADASHGGGMQVVYSGYRGSSTAPAFYRGNLRGMGAVRGGIYGRGAGFRGGFGRGSVVGGSMSIDLRPKVVLVGSRHGGGLPSGVTEEKIRSVLKDVIRVEPNGTQQLQVEFGSRKNAEFAVERGALFLGMSDSLVFRFPEQEQSKQQESDLPAPSTETGTVPSEQPTI